MDEPTALLNQAKADRKAAERFGTDVEGTDRCHAIAKWQQTVEKSVKALVYALHNAGILNINFRPRHEVAPYIKVLIRLPRPQSDRAIQQLLHGLLDQDTQAGIKALDDLAPQLSPRRNTEYPFRDVQGQWTYPAAADVFTEDEVVRFRKLAYRVLDGAERVVSAIRRRP